MKIARSLALAGALMCAAPLAAAEVDVKTGGVGEEARQGFMQSYGDYNLHLAFAEKSGAFLADVDVAIRDARGKEVWSGTVDGPMLFARVPSGRYAVSAEFDGATKQRTIQVGSAPGRMHYIHWDVAGVPEDFLQSSVGGSRSVPK